MYLKALTNIWETGNHFCNLTHCLHISHPRLAQKPGFCIIILYKNYWPSGGIQNSLATVSYQTCGMQMYLRLPAPKMLVKFIATVINSMVQPCKNNMFDPYPNYENMTKNYNSEQCCPRC